MNLKFKQLLAFLLKPHIIIAEMVPEAIQRECAHCTDLQRKVIEKMMCYLNNHQPDILKQVAAKFDPNGEYMKQYINMIEQKEYDQLSNPQLNQKQPQQNLQEQTKTTTVTTAPIATVTQKH